MADTSVQSLVTEALGAVAHLSEVVNLLDVTSTPVRWVAPERDPDPGETGRTGSSPLAGRLQGLIYEINRQRDRVNEIIGTFEVDGSQDTVEKAADPMSVRMATGF